MLKECKKTYNEKIRKNIWMCVYLLEQGNLYGCSDMSSANFLDNKNIMIFSFYREKFMFLMYISHVIKYIKTQSLEKSIQCLTNHM